MANSTQATMMLNGVKLTTNDLQTLTTTTVPSLAINTLAALNVVSVIAVDNEGVILPAGMPRGTIVVISNQDAGQDVKVYPNTGATINGGTATTAGMAIGQTQGAMFVQAGTDGLTWLCLLGAVAVAS